MKEKENLIKIFEEVKIALKDKNYIKIKQLSNQTIHTASIYQDPDNIAIAVLIYSLSKFIERENYKKYKQWPSFLKNFTIMIDRAILAIKNNQEGYFYDQLKKMRAEIDKLSGNFRKHAQGVFEKAKINKASRIYEHGISLEQTAKLLGISIWELTEYAGQTGIADVDLNITLDVKKRIKNTFDIFEK